MTTRPRLRRIMDDDGEEWVNLADLQPILDAYVDLYARHERLREACKRHLAESPRLVRTRTRWWEISF